MPSTCRTLVALAALCLACSGHRAEAGSITIFTGVPKGATTPDNLYTLQIDGGNGVLTTVEVDGINATDTPTATDKAAKIRAAIPARFKPTGVANQVKFNAASVRITNDPTAESYDGFIGDVSFKTSLSLGGTSTGSEPDGATPSVVRAGIQGIFVASIDLTSSLTAESIIKLLSKELNDNGIANSVSSDGAFWTLSLINFIDPSTLPSGSQGFEFGNTDTGLSLQASITVIPEPASLILLGIGAVSVVVARARRA